MKIHITGADGFLAAYVREALGPEHRLELSDVRELDVTDLDAALAGIAPDTDVVCHLAGLTGAAESARAPDRYFRVNATGTLNVLEACRRHGIRRVVFMSTLTVHGESDRPVTEDSPLAPRHPYAASKAAAEMMLSTYARSFGIGSAILRATLVAGEGQTEANGVSEFAEIALEGGTIDIFGDGSHEREWLHPVDLGRAVARSIDWLAARDTLEATRFIISSRRPVAMADLARKVLARVGSGELTFSRPTFQAFSLTTASTRARDLLGWEAETSIDKIVDRVVSDLEGSRQALAPDTR